MKDVFAGGGTLTSAQGGQQVRTDEHPRLALGWLSGWASGLVSQGFAEGLRSRKTVLLK